MVSDTEIRIALTLNRGGFPLEARFQCPGRGVTAVYGPSGAGKSTLLRAIAGLESDATGTVHVNGARWLESDTGHCVPIHRRDVGFVFQETALFPHHTVAGNLRYGWHRTPAAARRVTPSQAADWFGLGPLLQRYPHQLSGGERQRAAIARSVLAGPALLLMDEPLAALDPAAKTQILDCLERLHTELTVPVLYVSHSLEEVARLAHHLVLIAAGRVYANGPLTELLARLDLPTAHGDQAGAVLEASVAAHDQQYRLTELTFAGGRLTIAQQDRPLGHPLRVRILARDVSLALEAPHHTSVLNIISSRVMELSPEPPAQVMVRLDAGGAALLARITRKSADALGLRPGLAVYAQVKSVALM
ncbi:MAG: molybdenum ABC transporter ATP-binding protein [Chromatiales bacterium 21-64-14]|nr:MAG: molybdenum ABC transporter ATP-binding protein [Chromatiales bacterium 21-64-14]HQU14834.1 molybdenum ABC transporter ATP-binding protein [Gammaproteobacteria bacterium]